VSGPIQFDRYGDLVPHNDTYITVTFDPSSRQLRPGRTIPLP
jgi:hypothetical protein